ncbi:hypothetical protein EV679_1167 [Kerstersia gyiorum]|uniref:Uncharacterized protein n=1 Tax=Kerstersia gyiorum TaxID=206506 RepID=A0A4Q7MXY3_9BURK|nr:hypothetical protein [Kerstersia gyiorum]KAB0542725.1 hypothetical protein F7P85_11755 [Kerstersia gyiorum]RZS73958.1 hypothetical protein EV679_1167 [Kerstersia gyiorum]
MMTCPYFPIKTATPALRPKIAHMVLTHLILWAGLQATLVPAQAATSAAPSYRTLGILNTAKLPGAQPGQLLYSQGKFYGSVINGGKDGKAFLQRWGRLFVGAAAPGAAFQTLDASDIQGQDLGRGAMLEYVSPGTGTIYGWRPYQRPLDNQLEWSRPEQRSAILKWTPGQPAPDVLEVDNALEFSPHYQVGGLELGAFGTTWAEDSQGNIYIPAWNSGLFQLNAEQKISPIFISTQSVTTPKVPDASLPPVVPDHIWAFPLPNPTMCLDMANNYAPVDCALYFPPAGSITVTYEYWPNGSNTHAVVHSSDHGGTLYVLVGGGNTYTAFNSETVNEATKWIGTYPNASIPMDDSAGAAILAVRTSELNGTDAPSITFLQSLARARDGQTVFESSGLITPAPNGMVEVGDYLYGTTDKVLWRYNKAEGSGGTIEHVHVFNTAASDGSITGDLNTNTFRPYGPMVLAKDGWLYGTAANRVANARNTETGELGSVKDYGAIFRVKPGHTTTEEDDASFEIVHRMAILDGTHPIGLSSGPVTTQADGRHIHTLLGANRWGGYARSGGGDDIDPSRYTPSSERGGGSFFALDLTIPAMLTLNPASIQAGQSAELSWSTNSLSCQARSSDGSFNGAQGVSGKLQLQPAQNGRYTYELDCRDAQGRVYGDAVSLQVGDAKEETPGDTDNDGDSGSGGGPLGWPLGLVLLALLAARPAMRQAGRPSSTR